MNVKDETSSSGEYKTIPYKSDNGDEDIIEYLTQTFDECKEWNFLFGGI